MNDYTPATTQVKYAYVTFNRDAFIASTAEHEAEFDRWLAQVRADALEDAAQIADVRSQQIQALIGTESEVEADKDRIAGVTAELIAHRIRARAASIRETGTNADPR